MRSTSILVRAVPCALVAALLFSSGGAALGEDEPAFPNPYFEKTEWKVWRDDDKPVEGITSLVREGKEKKQVPITLAPIAKDKRTYPVEPPQKPDDDPYLVFKASATPSKKFAGMWDDVYASWSGLHGYVRTRWRAPDKSNVTVRGQIMDFVDVRQNAMMAAGVNFVHQSTTSMGHGITNGLYFKRTMNFEQLYFADLLVTSPAHASITDHRADFTQDLYTAHVSTLFNSCGSSNSETMAITKMAIVGAYFSPSMKLLLKRNGLYPAALLYIWKAALPYAVPYGHELRHRICYKAVGDRVAYSKVEKYNATSLDRGEMSLPYHQYDDQAHMRAMVDIARSMDVALPEAVFSVIRAEGEGDEGYKLRKAAMIVQEKGKDITLTVSTESSYDLQGLPLNLRWRLLYGNKETTIKQEPPEEGTDDPGEWTIHVPWDDALPEGRTAIALIANNGRFDSNPAIITVYRKKSEALPPSGMGPGDYKWPGTHNNRRPVILGLQDGWVKPGSEFELPIQAFDPEGFPVTYYKRGGEVGALDGSTFTWRSPRRGARPEERVTLIASDACGGSSYGGEAFTIHVGKPAVLAQIGIKHLVGKAPMTVKVSAKPSLGKKLKYGWDFYQPSYKRKPLAFEKMEHGREASHTFKKPGIYEVALAVEGAAGKDAETIRVYVTKGAPPKRKAALRVEGGGVLVREGDTSPDAFDDTDFGVGQTGAEIVRTFHLINTGDADLRLDRKAPVTLSGDGASAFRVVGKPRRTIEPRGSSLLRVRFKPKEAGVAEASVEIKTSSKTYRFTVRGTAR